MQEYKKSYIVLYKDNGFFVFLWQRRKISRKWIELKYRMFRAKQLAYMCSIESCIVINNCCCQMKLILTLQTFLFYIKPEMEPQLFPDRNPKVRWTVSLPELLACREIRGFLESSSSRRWRSISSLEREISFSYSTMVLPNTVKISSAAAVSRWLIRSRNISIFDISAITWEDS